MQHSTCSHLVPLCISPHQLSQMSDLSLPDPTIPFAQDLSWAVSWATTQKDTALQSYSPASMQQVQATPDDVSSVSFLLSILRCLPHCSLTAVDMMCISHCLWLVSNSYYRASRAYRVYCTRPEGAKRPRASTINTVRNIEAL